MSTSIKLFATLAAIILMTSCESSTNGRTSATSSTRSPRRADSAANPTYDAPAVHNKIKDCRILLYDPRTGATIIVINKKHAWRKTEKGQLAITNGKRNRTYKILTDKQIDSLLVTLTERGSDQIRENFHQRHAALLRHKAQRGDGFKGIIIVENDGHRYSYIARRPGGKNDAQGIAKYKIFRDMRAAIFVFERAGLSEQVGSSATGAAPLDKLAVPSDSSNRR